MIKLGNVIVNEEFIAAIEPERAPPSDRPGIVITLSTGGTVTSNAKMEEVRYVLERAGLIEPLERPARLISLFPHEVNELRWHLDRGYHYLAKDEDGRVFAFSERPTKGKSSWLNDDAVSSVKRLLGDYDALSFDDVEPLEITAVLNQEGEQ